MIYPLPKVGNSFMRLLSKISASQERFYIFLNSSTNVYFLKVISRRSSNIFPCVLQCCLIFDSLSVYRLSDRNVGNVVPSLSCLSSTFGQNKAAILSCVWWSHFQFGSCPKRDFG